MSSETYRKTTDATQAYFLAHKGEVLSQHLLSGNHPNNKLLERLARLLNANQTPEKLAVLNAMALSYTPLADVLSQYVDMSGEPKAAVNMNGGVALQDKTACFGRACGFQPICWEQCSLGPSRKPDGSLAPGCTEGAALVRHPSGYPLSQESVPGVLHGTPNPQDGQPRHRSDACVLLSMFCHVFAVPPAPTSALADALYDQVAGTIGHVESRQAEVAQPAQAAPPTAAAPTTAAPPMAAPPQAAPPQAAPPQATPPVPPTGAPPTPPGQPPAAATPATPPSAPPTEPAPQATAPAETPVEGGPQPSFFDNTTIEQEWELRALRQALINTDNKPKSAEAVDNMIERNKATYKKCRASLFKACAERGMTTDSSLKTGRLKAEFWGDVEIPQGYFEGGVPEETTSAPPAVAESQTTPAPEPETATEEPAPTPPTEAPAPPSSPPGTLAIKPQAPAQPQQRVDKEQDPEPETVPEEPAPADESEELLQRLEADVEKGKKVNLHTPKGVAEWPTGTPDSMALLAKALDNFTAAYRERTEMMSRIEVPMEPAPTAKLKKEPNKPEGKPQPTAKKKSAAKKASSASGKKSSKASAVAEPHPQHPKVQKDPAPWQPGSRGRPPKGVTKHPTTGKYKFPAGWKEIDGLWHPPMPK